MITTTTTILAAIVCLTVVILGLLGYAAVRAFTRSKYEIANLEIKHDEHREAHRIKSDQDRYELATKICAQYLPIFEQAMRRMFTNSDEGPQLFVYCFESTDELRTWVTVAQSGQAAHDGIVKQSPGYAGKIMMVGRIGIEDGSFVEFETAEAGRRVGEDFEREAEPS
jgi:hypothetical protein